MANPLIVGITSELVAPIERRRALIRFQNTGATIIYIKKIPLEGVVTDVSPTDYQIALYPAASSSEGGEAFDTTSIASFRAISSAAGGLLAVYETKYI